MFSFRDTKTGPSVIAHLLAAYVCEVAADLEPPAVELYDLQCLSLFSSLEKKAVCEHMATSWQHAVAGVPSGVTGATMDLPRTSC